MDVWWKFVVEVEEDMITSVLGAGPSSPLEDEIVFANSCSISYIQDHTHLEKIMRKYSEAELLYVSNSLEFEALSIVQNHFGLVGKVYVSPFMETYQSNVIERKALGQHIVLHSLDKRPTSAEGHMWFRMLESVESYKNIKRSILSDLMGVVERKGTFMRTKERVTSSKASQMEEELRDKWVKLKDLHMDFIGKQVLLALDLEKHTRDIVVFSIIQLPTLVEMAKLVGLKNSIYVSFRCEEAAKLEEMCKVYQLKLRLIKQSECLITIWNSCQTIKLIEAKYLRSKEAVGEAYEHMEGLLCRKEEGEVGLHNNIVGARLDHSTTLKICSDCLEELKFVSSKTKEFMLPYVDRNAVLVCNMKEWDAMVSIQKRVGFSGRILIDPRLMEHKKCREDIMADAKQMHMKFRTIRKEKWYGTGLEDKKLLEEWERFEGWKEKWLASELKKNSYSLDGKKPEQRFLDYKSSLDKSYSYAKIRFKRELECSACFPPRINSVQKLLLVLAAKEVGFDYVKDVSICSSLSVMDQMVYTLVMEMMEAARISSRLLRGPTKITDTFESSEKWKYDLEQNPEPVQEKRDHWRAHG